MNGHHRSRIARMSDRIFCRLSSGISLLGFARSSRPFSTFDQNCAPPILLCSCRVVCQAARVVSIFVATRFAVITIAVATRATTMLTFSANCARPWDAAGAIGSASTTGDKCSISPAAVRSSRSAAFFRSKASIAPWISYAVFCLPRWRAAAIILPSFRRIEISNLSSGFMEGLPALRMSFPNSLPRDSGPGQCVIAPPTTAGMAGRRARYDLAAMLALAKALGRRAPFASGLWIIMVAAISRIPLSFFCSRHAIQLRSVHIRISADRPVGLFFAVEAPRADARRDVVGCRLSRILRLRRPLSPPAADSRVYCLQVLRRSNAAPKPKSRAFGNRHWWRSVAARVFQICGVFSRDSQRGDRHRLAEAEYRSADRHLFFHIHADRLSGRRLPRRGARVRAIPLCAFRLVFPSSHCWSDLPSQGDHAAVPPPRKFPLRYLQLRLRVDLVRARTRQENPIRRCRGAICHADFQRRSRGSGSRPGR